MILISNRSTYFGGDVRETQLENDENMRFDASAIIYMCITAVY